MKTLREIFESVRHSMHWGPSLEPFHDAVVESHAALEARVAVLEAERIEDKAMMDVLRSEWNVMFPKYGGDPQYISDPAPERHPAQAASDALGGTAADDPASLTEGAPAAPAQNPAEPVQTPVPDLLGASPEPVPAGPDASAGPGDPSAENAAAPSEAPPAAPVVDQAHAETITSADVGTVDAVLGAAPAA